MTPQEPSRDDLEALPSLSDLGADAFLLRRYAAQGSDVWSAFNPSIAQDESGVYWVVFRASNYFFSREDTIGLTIGSKIRNRMFIGRLDPITMLFDETSIKEVDTKRLRSDIERGIEDARLFFDGKNWCLSATFLEHTVPVARICKIILKSLEHPEVLKIDILPAPDEKRVEKNWMPIHKVGLSSKVKTDFMYDATTTFAKGTFNKLSDDPRFTTFRGGTQVLPLGDGTSICLIHETYTKTIKRFSSVTFTNQRKVRKYAHRFVRLNQKYEIIQMSEQFVLVKEGIEFASGIAPYKDGFVISFGRQDVASYLATIDLGHLLLTLKDV